MGPVLADRESKKQLAPKGGVHTDPQGFHFKALFSKGRADVKVSMCYKVNFREVFFKYKNTKTTIAATGNLSQLRAI